MVEDDQTQFPLEIHLINSSGGLTDILKSNINSSDLIGAEIIEIIPDEFGSMFRLRLKDDREIVFVQGIEGTDYYFILIKEQETSRDSAVSLH